MSDDISLGRMVRDVRISRGLRQADVAAAAGVSRQAVSRLERGEAAGMTVAALRAISGALRMPSMVTLGWRAPELERIRDRQHAALVEAAVGLLGNCGWETVPELSFNRFGERGAIDVLGWHEASRTLLVVEVKTRIWDLQETLSVLDRKRRLAPKLAWEERGWSSKALGVVLLMPELSSHRHVLDAHASTFRSVLPDRQIAVKQWLREPAGELRGVLFLPNSHQNDIRRGRIRAKRRSRTAGGHVNGSTGPCRQ